MLNDKARHRRVCSMFVPIFLKKWVKWKQFFKEYMKLLIVDIFGKKVKDRRYKVEISK